ncbi:hypothetical protein NNJEOMEG_00026 [Fundidesulfovibrio magnetotacticus]|uniref:Uncharacterized protein n=1 Tax=Fundidesulfovibrio magnetotacticus TaxID=2730080 RepID=A0A6V8LVD2_9BACT|nr:hypothetical protein [Fundidesulfovibrio magnetotacticus]GFK92205.1 hypothetical protein NNJEOMEG_00026 [Fundidesulfovibrio magnetotacticus]
MAFSERVGRFIGRLMSTLKSESAEWQKANLPELDKLQHDREVARLELKHNLESMDIRFREERNRIRLEEERQTTQFAEFLDSIDEMKVGMLDTYASMPKPIALMIHHHASELLKEAWFSEDARERLRNQSRFTDLMLTITQDLSELGGEASPKALPEKTLAFIQNRLDK